MMQDIKGTAARPQQTSGDGRYDAIATGLRNYWYPITWSRRITNAPRVVNLLGEEIVLIRDQGKLYALQNRCPHRGIPLSLGRREFPGTWACRYHGWVFDLATGVVKAALTDGPDAPICGRAQVRTYPTEERLGLVWIYMGDSVPPPLELDVPDEMLAADAVILGRFTLQKGNWRYACENAFDEGHFKYLHRYGVLFSLFSEFPAWSTIRVLDEGNGWITREVESLSYSGKYEGLGLWPPKMPWKRRHKGFRLSMRLPGIMRNQHLGKGRTNYSWYVPVGRDQYHYLQFYVMRARGLTGLWFRVLFWCYLRWAHFVQFNNQDLAMVELLPETPPVRLYRPDASIIAWRKMCETARQFAGESHANDRQFADQPAAE
jgi:phenylpropionate dioxygenase-like ring-hydroxylating dioxygenase large terminal subunit